ncbi:MAG: glycosyltransferase family 2 protein [Candidatus Woesearchaeota archaeon]|jgi:hypothetical protein
MKKKPQVSVIIVNWNGGEVFKNCLDSLKKIEYSNWELIVVDNGSTDGTQKYAQIKNKTNLGFALANNQGVKLAKGKYVLLLNNDTLISKDLPTVLVSKMENDSTIGIIQPKILMMDKLGYLDNAGSFFTKIGFLEHWGFGQKDSKKFSKETEVFSAKGACLLIRHEIIKKIGLFDDDFVSYFEESDFCWRTWLNGWRVIFYPETKIYHKVGFTIQRLDVGEINYHYYKNRISSLIKNLGTLNLIMIVPIHLLISIGIAMAFLFRNKPSNSILILKAIYWNITNIQKILKKRKIIQSSRKVFDNKLFPKLLRPINLKKFYNDFKRVEKDIDLKNVK